MANNQEDLPQLCSRTFFSLARMGKSEMAVLLPAETHICGIGCFLSYVCLRKTFGPDVDLFHDPIELCLLTT
jgi:hypothetical protein